MNRTSGIVVLISDSLLNLDSRLLSFIQLSVKTDFTLNYDLRMRILRMFLRNSDNELLQAIEGIFANFELSIPQIQTIVSSAIRVSDFEKRSLTQGDILEEIASVMALDYELNRETTLHYEQVESDEEILQLSVLKGLKAWAIPSDGRVNLAFTMESLIRLKSSTSHPVRLTTQFHSNLKHADGDFCIVDWGWPKGLWEPSEGLLYRLDSTGEMPTILWQKRNKTFGPVRKNGGCGKQWQRLV